MKTAIKNLPNSMGNKKIGKLIIIAALLFFLVPTLAMAVPNLQLYIPDSTYDPVTETWIYPGLEYDLWAIGADSEASYSGQTTILDVKLAAAVKPDQTGTITILPYDPEGFLGNGVFSENSTPVKSDGNALPPHGIYPSDFYEFELGDFVLDEYGIPDFTEDYDPDNPVATNAWGKIMKYHVLVTGYDWVHFDLYDHIIGDNRALFAPFSHDAGAEDGGGTSAPEPTTMLLLGSGLIGLGWVGRRKMKKGSKV